MTVKEMWDELEEMGVSKQTLRIVADINGYSEKTMRDVMCAYIRGRVFPCEEEEAMRKDKS